MILTVDRNQLSAPKPRHQSRTDNLEAGTRGRLPRMPLGRWRASAHLAARSSYRVRRPRCDVPLTRKSSRRSSRRRCLCKQALDGLVETASARDERRVATDGAFIETERPRLKVRRIDFVGGRCWLPGRRGWPRRRRSGAACLGDRGKLIASSPGILVGLGPFLLRETGFAMET